VKLTRFITVALGLVLAGFLVRIYQHNVRIRTLYTLQGLESQRDELHAQIETLKIKIATEHYTTLASRATQLGFVDAHARSKTVEAP
jgi:hypothetical protein